MSPYIEPSAWVLYAASVLAITTPWFLATLAADALVFLWRWCGFAADSFDDNEAEDGEFSQTITDSVPQLPETGSAESASSSPDHPYSTHSTLLQCLDSRITILESQILESLRRIANLEKTSIKVVNGDGDDDDDGSLPPPLPFTSRRPLQAADTTSSALKRRRGAVDAILQEWCSGQEKRSSPISRHRPFPRDKHLGSLKNLDVRVRRSLAAEIFVTPADSEKDIDDHDTNEAPDPADSRIISSESAIENNNSNSSLLSASVVRDLSAGPMSLHPFIASAAEPVGCE
ncbi:hypothetical protein BDZ88DRAFT_83216 [Geranomyces variabilis]|nr:hypothetical protein BDZ88DRAFT_83216 [Geranomyces variabilis]KAJ3139957.1 hypothetical protein HDU90_008858 [Geranomyces variabilis]